MRVPGFRFVQAAGNYTDKDGLHYGIAVHATANTASDEAESSYASHREDGTSSHAYVDSDSLTQALDTDRKAGHAGSSTGNENSLAIEFTGLNSWSRERWLSSIAWSEVGRWVAYILQNDPDYRGFQVRRASVAEMQSNPRVKAFYSHDDMRRAWGGTDHTDPGPSFPWDRLFQAVNNALGEDDDMALDDPSEFTQQFTWETYDTDGGPWLGGTMRNQLQHMRETTFFTKRVVLRLEGQVMALATALEHVVAAGGGSFDTAALMAHVDQKLEELAAETRDAVADLGEGGAAQVRADAD